MKAFTISFAIIAAALVTGCSGQGTASNTSQSQQPQIIYEGDPPESARLKAHATCLAGAYKIEAYSSRLQAESNCNSQFKKSLY